MSMNNKNNLDGSLWEDMASKIKESEELRKSIIWSKMSIAGYIWDIIRNVITLFVVVAIYNSVYGSFEKIIVSLLILIYLTVISYGSTLALGNAKGILMTYSQMTEIRKGSGQTETEEEKDEFTKANFALEKILYKFYLNSVFNGLIYFIVIIRLLHSL